MESAVAGAFAGTTGSARVNNVGTVMRGDEGLPSGDQPERRKEGD
jgi:hypothetical protein